MGDTGDDGIDLGAIANIFLMAAAGDSDALNLLLGHPSICRLLAAASISAHARYKVDQDDIREFVQFQLWNKIHTIRSIKSLPAWTRRVAKNFCLNQIRHHDYEIDYEESVKSSEHQAARRNCQPMISTFASSMI
jgi:DNA-directed RNA polymerase specialized sigma24 family protein